MNVIQESKFNKNNKTVNGLWIGSALSSLELLTINSFLAHGHDFVLWTYEKLETMVPAGVIIKNANQIIPFDKIFRYKNKDQFGHGQGSLAGFSDIFRYKLLFEKGGWWVDMDVTCLKPLDFQSPYVFRPHHDIPVVGNVMKCPKGSPLMKYCFERASAEVDENNRDWHLPIQILNDGIQKFNLSEYITDFANPESWIENRKMITQNIELPVKWYVIHWINEEWRRSGIDKNYSGKNSILLQLYVKYGIPVGRITPLQKVRSWYNSTLPLCMILHSPPKYRYFYNEVFKRLTHAIKSFSKKIYWFCRNSLVKMTGWIAGNVKFWWKKVKNKRK